ncbi:hypothetical protein [Enterococcus sp. S22(2020)]|nr:hypothetical protein [Enterococcus sp. S22(2020)]
MINKHIYKIQKGEKNKVAGDCIKLSPQELRTSVTKYTDGS